MRKRVILKIPFEFEITPQQLSQVTPGGGVLKLTLSRKGPLRITTEAQNKRPDPSQTTIKTAYYQNCFEDQRIKPREAPNDKRDESFPEDGVQLGKLIQVVMVILVGMGDQIKAGNHPERGKNHQMGLGG